MLIASFLPLLSCTSTLTPTPPLQTSLLIYRFNPPAFVEYSADLQPIKEISFSISLGCGLNNTFPAPVGKYLLIEFNCPNGQTVLFLDVDSGSTTQPVTDSDSHFLAWTPDGKAAYLRVDSLGNAHVIRAFTDGTRQDDIPITAFTYDLAPKPASRDFTFTFSRGLSQGSELWLAGRDGGVVKQLYTDQFNYISFAHYSPDGKQIAFIKIPDTQTPFTVGGLWVMDADGSNARKLANADAGHGYAANWSPDGKRIAFVVRENPADENANLSSEALISNIYVLNVETGSVQQITKYTNGRAETPLWSPDGNTLAFNVVIDGRMTVSIAEIGNVGVGSPDPVTVKIKPLGTGSACCPVWMRK